MAEGIDPRKANRERNTLADRTRALNKVLPEAVKSTREMASTSVFKKYSKATGEGIVDALVKSGAVKEAGESLGSAFGTVVAGVNGEDAGYTAASMIDGGTTGAMTGAMIVNGLAAAGTAAAIPGGQIIALTVLLGTIFGAVKGAAKAQEKRLAAFQSYIGGMVTAVESAEMEGLQRGILTKMESPNSPFYQAEAAWQAVQSAQDTAKGTGYAIQRTGDLNENVDLYEDTGLTKAMTEINQAIGQSEAYLVGRKDDYEREAFALLFHGAETGTEGEPLYKGKGAERLGELHTRYDSLLTELDAAKQDRDEEKQAEIGIELKGLKEEAITIAESMYEASDISLRARDTELLLIEAVRENTDSIQNSWNRAYNRAQVLSGESAKQYLSPEKLDTWGPETNAITSSYQVRPGSGIYGRYDFDRNQGAAGEAYGLNRALNHDLPVRRRQEERARAADRGGGVNVTFSGPVTVRQEADLDKLARKLAAEVRRAKLLAAT